MRSASTWSVHDCYGGGVHTPPHRRERILATRNNNFEWSKRASFEEVIFPISQRTLSPFSEILIFCEISRLPVLRCCAVRFAAVMSFSKGKFHKHSGITEDESRPGREQSLIVSVLRPSTSLKVVFLLNSLRSTRGPSTRWIAVVLHRAMACRALLLVRNRQSLSSIRTLRLDLLYFFLPFVRPSARSRRSLARSFVRTFTEKGRNRFSNGIPDAFSRSLFR